MKDKCESLEGNQIMHSQKVIDKLEERLEKELSKSKKQAAKLKKTEKELHESLSN